MRDVKSRQGTLRAERAATTRRRIETAARWLFARDGYAATTLQAIAVEAGVAVQTVYAVYASKAGILRVLRESVRDDPEAGAAFTHAIGAAEAGAAIDAFARSIRLRWEHGADVHAIHAQAAASDPSVRVEVDAVLEVRRQGIGRFATALAALDPALGDPSRITAIADALSMPDVYLELTRVHAWSPEAYEGWLADALRAGLLARTELSGS